MHGHTQCVDSRSEFIERKSGRAKESEQESIFKEPIKIDGYYFEPSGKPGLGYEYDERFVVSRKRLA